MDTSILFTPDSLITPEVLADPYPAYRQLCPNSPLLYPYLPAGIAPHIDKPVMAWALMRHADVYQALRDHDTFCSGRHPLCELGLSPRLTLLFDDPPRHSRLRRLVNRAFTTRRIEALEPWITQIVAELLDEIGTGETEMMQNFAIPLPMMVIARLLGIPMSEYRTFRTWSEAFVSTIDMPYEERQKSIGDMSRYFGQMALERRTQGAEDLITALVEAKVEGEALEDAEILGFCIVLLIAGNETTVNLLGAMLHLLAKRPDLWQLLKADRTRVDDFIEETLRFESPIQRMPRRANRAVEISGITIAKDDIVILFYGAANRDPEAFPEPDEFRLDRNLKYHVAFGAGIHYCMGTPLALTEARIAINAFLGRYSALRLGNAPPVRQSSSGTVLGFQQLSIICIPKERE